MSNYRVHPKPGLSIIDQSAISAKNGRLTFQLSTVERKDNCNNINDITSKSIGSPYARYAAITRAAQMNSTNMNANVTNSSYQRQGSDDRERDRDREKRRRKRRGSGDGQSSSSWFKSSGKKTPTGEAKKSFPTNFGSALAKNSLTVPPSLLKKVNTKEVQGLGKVRVVLRLSSSVPMKSGESQIMTIDKRKRQVTLREEPAFKADSPGQENRPTVGVAAPKMFAFDQVYGTEEPQTEVVTGALVDVLHAVLAGNDGCVLSFGGSSIGKSYTMLGSHTSAAEFGVIPSAVGWIYKTIKEQKSKTGARFSVRVSAVAVDATGTLFSDLLADYAHGQEGETSPGSLLRDGTGILSSAAELRAPTPDAAGYYIDVALAARAALAAASARLYPQNNQPLSSGSPTLLYTLHVYQYSVDKSSKGGVVGGRSRLHLIDVGDTSGRCPGNLSISALTSVLLAIFNGQKYLPHRESKLTSLLQEALGSITCHAAMVVHVSPSPIHTQHSLATLQMASRVHKMRRKKLRGVGSSGSGSSEGSRSRSSGGGTSNGSSVDFSSSEQSADTVIYIGGVGPGDSSDGEHPPIFLPHHIRQSRQPGIQRLRSMEQLRPHSASPVPNQGRRPASASPTPTSRSVPNGRSHLKPKPPPRTVTNLNYRTNDNNNSNDNSPRYTPQGGFIRHQPGVSKVDYSVKPAFNSKKPFLSSFKPQIQTGSKSPGAHSLENKGHVGFVTAKDNSDRQLDYNPYQEPNALVPIFQNSNSQQPNQQQSIRYQQQFLNAQKLQQQHIILANPRAYPQQQQQLIITSPSPQFQYQQQAMLNKQQEFIQQQIKQKQQAMQNQQGMASKLRNDKARIPDSTVSDEQWVDGPRISKSKVAAGRAKTGKPETWVDGPQVNSHLCYGFMDAHKKSMIEKWVEVQTAQVANELETGTMSSRSTSQLSLATSDKNKTATKSVTNEEEITPFRTCEESTIDSDVDTISEEPSSTPAAINGEHPSLIEELERKNLIPSSTDDITCTTIEEGTPGRPPDSSIDTEGETEEQCSPDEGSGADEPSIEDICSQCEALAEECEELSSLLSCEEEECKRQVHQGLATVLEEPELESNVGVDDRYDNIVIRTHDHLKQLCKIDDGDETGHEADEECSEVGGGTTERKGKWLRRSVASCGTHHSTEMIEVSQTDHSVETVDSSIQVCEEEIIQALSTTPCPSEILSLATAEGDHPLRVLSEENLTCASTFTDSFSQIGETGDEDDSDEEDSRPFSIFEVTEYGRVCQDLSLALNSDSANRNLQELSKIHELYKTLARQSPRVHLGGTKLQASTLAEILTNSRDSLFDEKKPPVEEDSICSEPAVNFDDGLCNQCNKRRLKHGDSILRLESAMQSRSQWLIRSQDEDSLSDKYVDINNLDLPLDSCICDAQSDLVPYMPSVFFLSSLRQPDGASSSSLDKLPSEKYTSNCMKETDDVGKVNGFDLPPNDRIPSNGVPLPDFIEDVEANVVLCNPIQYEYSKEEESLDIHDERTITGKSDNESDCFSNVSEDSEYMIQTSRLSKFLCVGVSRNKTKTPYKLSKQNNNKVSDSKKSVIKSKDIKSKSKSRECSKSPVCNSKNLIKSPSRVVSQNLAKNNSNSKNEQTPLKNRWTKSRVVAAVPPIVRGAYNSNSNIVYAPNVSTPNEGYDSGHDSGATQGSATPSEAPENWSRLQESQQSIQHMRSPYHPPHQAGTSSSLGTTTSLGESSGYESIPRDSECSSFSSSQDSEMDDEHRKDNGTGTNSVRLIRPPHPPISPIPLEEWSEEDIKKYEDRPRGLELSQKRTMRQSQVTKTTQRNSKTNLNLPSVSWNFERNSNNYTSLVIQEKQMG